MDKGIRPYAINKFVELNAKRIAGELTNTAFRAEVMCDLRENFGINLASSATAYNSAKLAVMASNLLPDTDPKHTRVDITNLGRAEDKKGGRKPKAKVAETVSTATGEPVDAEAIVPTVFTVKTKNGDTVVAEGLSFEAAKALVEAAKAAKKKALYWV